MKFLILAILSIASFSSFAGTAGVNECVFSGREEIQKVKVVSDYNDNIKQRMRDANSNEVKLRALLTEYEEFNTGLFEAVIKACKATNK